MMPQFRFALISLAAICAPVFAQDAVPLPEKVAKTVDQLIKDGLTDDTGYMFVERLTSQIGPRLAGSDAEQRARDWAVHELNGLAFSNVRVEPFEIPYWSRLTDTAEIVSPSHQKLRITALGGSTSTPEGGVTGEVVRFESMKALEAADPENVKGKIVFIDEKMTRTQDGSGYGMAVRKRRNCAKETVAKGGLVCLIRSVGTQTRRFPHTGMMARGKAVGDGPAAALSPPDADQLARLLSYGDLDVKVKVNIQVETKEKAPSGNVIAEVVGREKPEEIILLGCHLDSWDLGTGAVDDGAGCGIVVGAAKLFLELEEQPKRTIRVVLYGSEEVGLLGGFAYLKAHKDNLDNHILAAESDFGADKIWRFDTKFGDGALAYAKTMQDILAPLGIAPGKNTASGGPDITMLARAGVPVVSPVQNGWDYFDLHHTPDDTLDKIDRDSLKQNIASYAAFAYLAAEMDWDFRKKPETEE